jgi:hypothetical protein
MITEIKNFSNKTLKEIMIEKLYKKIIIGKINNIKIADFSNSNSNSNSNENYKNIRLELNEFFFDLLKQTKIMKNLGQVIHTYFDKISLVSYDDIMETVYN